MKLFSFLFMGHELVINTWKLSVLFNDAFIFVSAKLNLARKITIYFLEDCKILSENETVKFSLHITSEVSLKTALEITTKEAATSVWNWKPKSSKGNCMKLRFDNKITEFSFHFIFSLFLKVSSSPLHLLFVLSNYFIFYTIFLSFRLILIITSNKNFSRERIHDARESFHYSFSLRKMAVEGENFSMTLTINFPSLLYSFRQWRSFLIMGFKLK